MSEGLPHDVRADTDSAADAAEALFVMDPVTGIVQELTGPELDTQPMNIVIWKKSTLSSHATMNTVQRAVDRIGTRRGRYGHIAVDEVREALNMVLREDREKPTGITPATIETAVAKCKKWLPIGRFIEIIYLNITEQKPRLTICYNHGDDFREYASQDAYAKVNDTFCDAFGMKVGDDLFISHDIPEGDLGDLVYPSK